MEILETELLGNTVWNYLLAAGLFFASMAALSFAKKMVFGRLRSLVEKTPSKHDDFILGIAERTLIPLLYVAALYFALHRLFLAKDLEILIDSAAFIFLGIQLARLAAAVAIYLMEHTWFKRGSAQAGTPVSKSILTIIKVVIWGLAVVFVLDNLGFNISAIVAGLGIGGIAIALAAQNILGDLFNYFVIFFDKPFEEGDFIIVDDFMGTIEHIGLKSTRIRALGGEQLVMSNTSLTGSRIRNYKRMAERRVVFKLGVVYSTSLDQLKKIPETIRRIIEAHPATRFDRAHFTEFGDSCLNFETVYFVLSPDYNKYMDIQQKINWAIKESFEKEGVEFAYPTQTVYEYRLSEQTAPHPSLSPPGRGVG